MTEKDEQQQYEERLRYRLKIFQENLKAEKINVAEHLQEELSHSIGNIQYDDNGEIILSSVDGRIRSMALAIEHFDTRDKLKKQISLNEIQNLYFELIEQNFGEFYVKMNELGETPNNIADFLSRNEDFVDGMVDQIPSFMDAILEFWRNVGDVGYWHLEDKFENITGVFGGDLFPAHDENIASKCGIYTDTIVLPDPYVRSIHIFEHYSKESKVYYLIKHALNLLKYKKLACTDTDTPIVVILPDLPNLEENGRDFIYNLSENDALTHASKLFDINFENIDEFNEFCLSLDTVEKTIKAIKDKNRVLFDTNWCGTLEEQIIRALKGDEFKAFNRSEPGLLLQMQTVGRMSVSNELLLKARQLSGTPLIEAETSWQFFNWKLEYDAEKAQEYYGSENLHITKGLSDLSQTDLPWLGNIPPESLLELRKQGALEEIRSILGNNISELVKTNPTNCFRTRDQILENIEQSFAKHREKLDELKAKNWKFAGKDIGSWIVMGTIGIGAALTGTPAWALAALAADQILDTPKLREIPQRYRDLIEHNREVKQSPVGILFKASKY
ncbi:hypothetical protein APD05_11815 [Acinetobacter nosocomialis]|uniref:hypothetical protein n=1 Tax=Acinetobacter calcoaceticus/baumannii complex TaxID=909768 RepID=UPI00029EA16E|nr:MULTISPECIES: hypothetical protein [Acinetobacter calcoaceticus/baumannii complex]EKU57120.1 hypothetical protein ACINWC487_A0106 [Acinetobacter nosocomialis]EXI08628.1 hypothetical protein J604_3951 [Acinetobacter sp. 694762]KQD11369.1 hypothetical protein APD05_11815 [Acinetobacter nosocomialis]MCU4575698.1 hypothetical protein [Acinetobacter nosocomialis]